MDVKITDEPGIRFPPPLIFLGFILAGLAIDLLMAAPFPRLPDWLRWGGTIAAGIAGISLVGSALALFRRAGTRPEPWQPANALTTRGIYSRTRNPMYLGMACLHLAIAVAVASFGALLSLVPAVIIIDRLVIRREEAYLSRRFGEPYLVYKDRVRRWI